MPSSTNPIQDSSDVYFWQEYGSEYGYMSQWYESPFYAEDKDTTFQNAEQYMMYQKAIVFKDEAIAAKILETRIPKEQKALGRQVSNFDHNVWLEHRERIVQDGSYYKFAHSLLEDEDLKEKLLSTGDKELCEASPLDRIWGIGYREENAPDMREEWGLNLLGKAIMHARERIRDEA